MIQYLKRNFQNLAMMLLCLFIWISPRLLSAQELLVDKVVAKVGSEFILLSEVEEEFSYAKTKDPTIEDEVKCVILDNMIAQKILIYQAKLDSVSVTDIEVDQQLDMRFESILRQMNGDEAFFEDYYGASVREWKERFRDDQKNRILSERMQGKMLEEIQITPKEVEKFFNSVPADSLPYFKSEMEISEIVMKPSVNADEKQRALDKITSLRDKVMAGTLSFEDAASKNSQDPGSALRQGDLGFAKRGIFVPEFEATVFALAKDEVSEIIETEFGFHFIKLIERRGNSVRASHVLIKPAITSVDLARTKGKLDSIRTLILADSISFEQAVRKYSFKDMPSYSNSGRVKNYNSNNTFFAADDFDPDTYFAIYELEVDGITVPIDMQMPSGEKAYRLLRLNSKSNPHRANLQQDFDKITTFARESKKNEYFLNWLKNKRKETFISHDILFSDCNLFDSKEIKP